MKLSLLTFSLALFLFSCKKSSDLTKDPQSQIQQIIAKYPNLKLISVKPESSTSGYPSSASFVEFDKEMAKLSELGKSIKVVPGSTKIVQNKTIPSEHLELESSGKGITTNESVYGGVYSWNATQTVGGVNMGYYNIGYFATFTYYTDYFYPSGINYFQTTAGVKSSAMAASFTVSASPGYNVYDYSYLEISAGGAVGTGSQVANLAFNGSVSVKQTYHFLTLSTVVASSSDPLSYNPSVAASTLPKLIP